MEADSGPAIAQTTVLTVVLKGDATFAAPGERLELDLSKFHTGRWALQLDAAMARRSEPVVVLARGVACLAVSWWAKLSPRSYLTNIRGAIFLSPLTIGFGQAAIAAAARLSPAIKLPFPSIVASAASPTMEQVLMLADSWGSRFVDAGAEPGDAASNRSGPVTAAQEYLFDLLRLLGGSAVTGDAPLAETLATEIRAVR
jgi:predicted alpha/beta hydrolase family esterase